MFEGKINFVYFHIQFSDFILDMHKKVVCRRQTIIAPDIPRNVRHLFRVIE